MKQIISSLVYLVLLFCLSTFVFDPTHLYYEIPLLDVPMHFLGGFGVASLALSIAAYKKYPLKLSQVFVAYLFVAVAWELYEFIVDMVRVAPWNGWSDTLSDIVNGGVGAWVAYFFLKK